MERGKPELKKQPAATFAFWFFRKQSEKRNRDFFFPGPDRFRTADHITPGYTAFGTHGNQCNRVSFLASSGISA